MSQTGSFGVNYKKVWDGVSIPLPAKLMDVGSSTEGEFVFVQADGAVDQYAFVKIEADGQVAMLTTTNAGSQGLLVGVAQVAAANNEYLWVWVGGLNGGGAGKGIKGKILTGYVAKNNINTTATAGVADDTSTTKIAYVVGLANTSGTQAVELFSVGHLKVN
ncbi:MAG: hypothetical protein ACK528_01245 [Alphaproteobacteria bacterium]|jgi:hypothetical protein